MLLQVLGALEALATEVALMRLKRDMDTDVRRDVVALHGCRAAVVPATRQVQVVGALATNMALTDMVIESLGRLAALSTFVPLAGEVVIGGDGGARNLGRRIG
jgi:hypothetical protein